MLCLTQIIDAERGFYPRAVAYRRSLGVVHQLSRAPSTPKGKSTNASPDSVNKSGNKRELTKHEVASTQLRKPLFPNDSAQESGPLEDNIHALSKENAAKLRKANEKVAGKTDVPPDSKIAKL